MPYANKFKNGLKWSDISFRYNQSSGIIEFFDKQNKERLRPQFLGSLISGLCPPIHVMLDFLSSHGTIYSDFGEILIRKWILNKKDSNILHVPRISMENKTYKFVISREKWLIKCFELFCPEKDAFSNWDFVINYFIKNNLPTSFFVKVFIKDLINNKTQSDTTKPQYINLSSPLLFKLFTHLYSNNEFLLIEEEFPKVKTKGKVSEYILEQTICNNKGDD